MANLSTSTLLPPEEGEETDPMSGLGNLMDVMLVFACGLILALIAHYNVNLSQQPDATNMQELQGELEYAQEGAGESGSTYRQLGMVYQDEKTGQLYVVEPDSSDSSESGGTAEESGSGVDASGGGK